MHTFPRGEVILTVSLCDQNLALPSNRADQCRQNDLKSVTMNPLLLHMYIMYTMLA